MPIPGKPPGISKKLWDSIVRRTKKEGPVEEPGSPPEDIKPGLWDAIKKKVKEILGPEEVKPEPRLEDEGPLDRETLLYRIRMAGRLNVLALMKHNGQFRHISVYEIKTIRKKPKSKKPFAMWDQYTPPNDYLFAHCYLHDQTEQFRLDKIERFYLTDIPDTGRKFPAKV